MCRVDLESQRPVRFVAALWARRAGVRRQHDPVRRMTRAIAARPNWIHRVHGEPSAASDWIAFSTQTTIIPFAAAVALSVAMRRNAAPSPVQLRSHRTATRYHALASVCTDVFCEQAGSTQFGTIIRSAGT